jgi:hypothetical protein
MGGYEFSQLSDSRPDADWAQLFLGEALSPRSTLYDLSSSTGPFVEDLLGGEVTQAIELHPNLVALWVGMPDLLEGMPPATFEQDLEQTLAELDRGHAEVLVANLLPIYRFPGYGACEARPEACGLSDGAIPAAAQLSIGVSAYDQAISAAASSDRDVLVNLTQAFTDRLGSSGHTSSSGALVDGSDLGLTPAGEQLVADTFKSAYSHANRPG